jgi:hypothetical protein
MMGRDTSQHSQNQPIVFCLISIIFLGNIVNMTHHKKRVFRNSTEFAEKMQIIFHQTFFISYKPDFVVLKHQKLSFVSMA